MSPTRKYYGKNWVDRTILDFERLEKYDIQMQSTAVDGILLLKSTLKDVKDKRGFNYEPVLDNIFKLFILLDVIMVLLWLC